MLRITGLEKLSSLLLKLNIFKKLLRYQILTIIYFVCWGFFRLRQKRGMMISGGEIITERAAITVIDEFRSGKLGRITLEAPQKRSE